MTAINQHTCTIIRHGSRNLFVGRGSFFGEVELWQLDNMNLKCINFSGVSEPPPNLRVSMYKTGHIDFVLIFELKKCNLMVDKQINRKNYFFARF